MTTTKFYVVNSTADIISRHRSSEAAYRKIDRENARLDWRHGGWGNLAGWHVVDENNREVPTAEEVANIRDTYDFAVKRGEYLGTFDQWMKDEEILNY